MQFLRISENSRLTDLSSIVGDRNIEYLLSANDLSRSANIGQQFYQKCKEYIDSTDSVDWQRKSTLLNGLTEDSDIFEIAALLNESGWKLLSSLGTFPGYLKVPESIVLPDSTSLLGNNVHIGKNVYDKAMLGLSNPPHTIDPGIFNEYSTIKASNIIDTMSYTSNNNFQFFPIPWGDVTFYSSLSDTSIDLPCYPEEISDNRKANYTTMPDLLYTYEPWYLYQSSGPRTITYSIFAHRDMWSGDHTDGKANELIRFFEANCYPEYNGSAVNTSTVTLYIVGRPHITGILEDVSVDWEGPILSDGWYAAFTLKFTITEISSQALNYNVVRNMPLIGE